MSVTALSFHPLSVEDVFSIFEEMNDQPMEVFVVLVDGLIMSSQQVAATAFVQGTNKVVIRIDKNVTAGEAIHVMVDRLIVAHSIKHVVNSRPELEENSELFSASVNEEAEIFGKKVYEKIDECIKTRLESEGSVVGILH